MHDVIDDDFARERILEANDGGNARARIGALAPAPVVAGLLAARHLLRAHLLELLLGAITAVRMTLGEQLLEHLLVAIESLGLIERPLVMIEARPLHAVENLLDGLAGRALEVRVLDAQDKFPRMPARVQPREQRRANATDVQHPVGLGAKRVPTVMDLGLGRLGADGLAERPDTDRAAGGAAFVLGASASLRHAMGG